VHDGGQSPVSHSFATLSLALSDRVSTYGATRIRSQQIVYTLRPSPRSVADPINAVRRSRDLSRYPRRARRTRVVRHSGCSTDGTHIRTRKYLLKYYANITNPMYMHRHRHAYAIDETMSTGNRTRSTSPFPTTDAQTMFGPRRFSLTFRIATGSVRYTAREFSRSASST
jgi:hypothetical protein